MFQGTIESLKLTPAYSVYRFFQRRKAYSKWEKRGRPIPPPPIIKQRIVKDYAQRFSLDTLVETGTYLGEMVLATKENFNRIFSIEIDKKLAKKTNKKFSKYSHITIIQGDSGEVLKDVISNIKNPCLFWLDSHYSGGLTSRGINETPIKQELEHIFYSGIKEHVILIDDARFFIGGKDYPKLQELKDFVLLNRPGWNFYVKNDIIRIHRKIDANFADLGSFE